MDMNRNIVIRINDFASEGIMFQIGVAPRRIDMITAIDRVIYEENVFSYDKNVLSDR